MLGAAFLPGPLGFLAWGAFVPLLIALEARVRSGARARRLFALGYQFGLAFFLIGTHWIARLSSVAITVPWLRYPAWLAAGAYLALFGGLLTLVAGTLARRVPLALVFPAALVTVEELRASGELGFPWFQPGYTQHAYAPLMQLASLGSVTLVTLWLAILNVLIWHALRPGSRARAALGAALVLALPWVWGERVLDAAPGASGVSVALVQGDIPGEIKWSGGHQREILDVFVRLSERAAVNRPSIVIWPETATGSYLRKQLDQAIEVGELAHRTGVPVFTGFADYDFGTNGKPRVYNSAGLFRPDGGASAAYSKRHLVPFGERMPFQRWIPALGRLELGQAEWTPGDRVVLFPGAAGPFACLICFESIFPNLSREAVRSGARWLVNITNDEWFGNSAAIGQHAAMAQFRAVENHVPLARCANTGLTEILDANGRVTAALPTFRAGVLNGPLSKCGIPTPYTRLGDWPGVLSEIALAVAARVALTRRKNAD
ncbi:MAG: apolipoprotein N-acyltransferase [Candidatus Eisenbacteria bacterium]|nr:apolipoprotein N-acyltransferase [Candidatus Eisenbacteria bacterium]